MKRVALLVLVVLSLSVVIVRAADDEPGIRPDPRPTDLTSKRQSTSDEPALRPDPRPVDRSAPRQVTGRSTLDVEGLTLEQSERIRAIRARAETDIQAIRDRERAEIMMVLNEQQQVEFLRRETALSAGPRRPATSPTTAPSP